MNEHSALSFRLYERNSKSKHCLATTPKRKLTKSKSRSRTPVKKRASQKNTSVSRRGGEALNKFLNMRFGNTQNDGDVKEKENKKVHRKLKKKRSSAKLDTRKPKMMVTGRKGVNEEECMKLVEKLRQRKAFPNFPNVKICNKSEFELDRVKKKTNMYFSKETTCPTLRLAPFELLPDIKQERRREDRVFSRTEETERKTKTETKTIEESPMKHYASAPKISEILKMPPENIFIENGKPFWMKYLEPTEEDNKDVEPAISIGSEHIDMYHDRKFVLKDPPEINIIIDQWQGLKYLMERDDALFTSELIFCNTVRSLINVAAKPEINPDENSVKKRMSRRSLVRIGDISENLTQEETMLNVFFGDQDKSTFFVYLRSDPIGTASRMVEVTMSEYESGNYRSFGSAQSSSSLSTSKTLPFSSMKPISSKVLRK